MSAALSVKEILTDRRHYIDLLLIGDEQEEMIERYINAGRLFIGFVGGRPVACIAVVRTESHTVEIKNLAVVSELRQQGIGRAMLRHVESLYPDCTIILGTGETPSTLRFYANCGYNYSHRIPGFFADNYDHPIVEEGVLLQDMIYLQKRPRNSQ